MRRMNEPRWLIDPRFRRSRGSLRTALRTNDDAAQVTRPLDQWTYQIVDGTVRELLSIAQRELDGLARRPQLLGSETRCGRVDGRNAQDLAEVFHRLPETTDFRASASQRKKRDRSPIGSGTPHP